MQKCLMEVYRYSYFERAQEVLNRYELGYSLTIDSDDLPVPKAVHQQLKEAQLQTLRDRLSHKVLHGVFINQTIAPDCDQKAGWLSDRSLAWLSDGTLRPTTEGLIVAAQDGVVHTRACQSRILKMSLPAMQNVQNGTRNSRPHFVQL